jgi:predicted enzyme related to lactoylglutathione lyase
MKENSLKASGFSAIVLWTVQLERMTQFYRALGLPLETEEHEEGPKHCACELGSTHFAIFEGSPGTAVGKGVGGCTLIGLQVSSVEHAYAAAKALGAQTLWEPREMPWGKAAKVVDPDGRPVELNAVLGKG